MNKKVTYLDAVLAVVKDNGKILVSLRRDKKLPGANLKYQLPGGKPKAGEDFKRTAVRETREETGWIVRVVSKVPLVYKHDWEYQDRLQKTSLHAYYCRIVKRSKLTRKMHQDAVWLTKEEILELDCLPSVKEFIELADKLDLDRP